VVARMQQLGMEPVGSTSEQYTNQIRQDIDKWAAIVKSAGIKLE
jgi:tripartite-type tricarboxylate transporter receptor subunit TctC